MQKIHTVQDAIADHMPADRLMVRYLAITCGVLFILYMYFVSMMVWHTVDRKIVEGHIRDTRAMVADDEAAYLAISAGFDADAVIARGFTIPKNVTFASTGSNAALSFNTAHDAF